MAASDHLQPKLFHGTSAWLKPGDIIEPRTRDEFYGPEAIDIDTDEPFPHDEHTGIGAYATPDLHEARKYAKESMDMDAVKAGSYADWEAQYGRTGMKPGAAPYQPALFAPVYPVEHVTEHSDPHGRIAAEGFTHRRDKVGFRVTGNPVEYAHYDDKEDWG